MASRATSINTTAAAIITWCVRSAAVRWNSSRRRLTSWNTRSAANTITPPRAIPSRYMACATTAAGKTAHRGFSDPMAKACPQCGFQMPDLAAFCPGCGLRMIVPASAETKASGHENLLGALAYVTLIPAMVFLLIEPYKRDRFVRFHSFQSLLLAGAGIALMVVLKLLFSILSLIPWLGYLIAWLSIVVVIM